MDNTGDGPPRGRRQLPLNFKLLTSINKFTTIIPVIILVFCHVFFRNPEQQTVGDNWDICIDELTKTLVPAPWQHYTSLGSFGYNHLYQLRLEVVSFFARSSLSFDVFGGQYGLSPCVQKPQKMLDGIRGRSISNITSFCPTQSIARTGLDWSGFYSLIRICLGILTIIAAIHLLCRALLPDDYATKGINAVSHSFKATSSHYKRYKTIMAHFIIYMSLLSYHRLRRYGIKSKNFIYAIFSNTNMAISSSIFFVIVIYLYVTGFVRAAYETVKAAVSVNNLYYGPLFLFGVWAIYYIIRHSPTKNGSFWQTIKAIILGSVLFPSNLFLYSIPTIHDGFDYIMKKIRDLYQFLGQHIRTISRYLLCLQILSLLVLGICRWFIPLEIPFDREMLKVSILFAIYSANISCFKYYLAAQLCKWLVEIIDGRLLLARLKDYVVEFIYHDEQSIIDMGIVVGILIIMLLFPITVAYYCDPLIERAISLSTKVGTVLGRWIAKLHGAATRESEAQPPNTFSTPPPAISFDHASSLSGTERLAYVERATRAAAESQQPDDEPLTSATLRTIEAIAEHTMAVLKEEDEEAKQGKAPAPVQPSAASPPFPVPAPNPNPNPSSNECSAPRENPSNNNNDPDTNSPNPLISPLDNHNDIQPHSETSRTANSLNLTTKTHEEKFSNLRNEDSVKSWLSKLNPPSLFPDTPPNLDGGGFVGEEKSSQQQQRQQLEEPSLPPSPSPSPSSPTFTSTSTSAPPSPKTLHYRTHSEPSIIPPFSEVYSPLLLSYTPFSDPGDLDIEEEGMLTREEFLEILELNGESWSERGNSIGSFGSLGTTF